MHWAVFRSERPFSTIFPPYFIPKRAYERIEKFSDTLPLMIYDYICLFLLNICLHLSTSRQCCLTPTCLMWTPVPSLFVQFMIYDYIYLSVICSYLSNSNLHLSPSRQCYLTPTCLMSTPVLNHIKWQTI